jgi:hypothetical protein
MTDALFSVGIPEVNLTSSASVVGGRMCLSTVKFSCTIQDLASLVWFVDEMEIVRYTHQIGDEAQVPFVEYDGNLGRIEIIRVQSSTSSDDINATSTLTTNTSVLDNISAIECGSRETRSNAMMVNVSVLGKYPLPHHLRYNLTLSTSCIKQSFMGPLSNFILNGGSKVSVIITMQ